MTKWLDVTFYEIKTTLRRFSFIFISFGIPLIAVLVILGIQFFRQRSAANASPANEPTSSSQLEKEGYVDQSGLVKALPPDLPAGILTAYPDEEAARAALDSGAIQAYYMIPDDYLAEGELVYVRQRYSVMASDKQDWIMRWAMTYNLAGGNLPLASRVWNPANLEMTPLPVPGAAGPGLAQDCQMPGMACESNALLRYLPMIFLITFFFSILNGAGLILNSMSSEKENRITEILLTSTSPMQLLAGKITAAGLLGLLQTATWLAAMYFSLGEGQSLFNLPEGFTLPLSLLAWGLIFYLFGYSLYAGLMAGASAVAPPATSASQITFTMGLPIYFAYFALLFQGFNPHTPFTIFLSLFPLTSPIAMPWRMIHGNVPSWQPLMAAILLALTVPWILFGTARIFRAQELLSGQPFSLRRYWSALWS